MVIQMILLWIQWMYLSISILMLNSQAEQVEGLFRLPEMPFFHVRIDSHDYRAQGLSQDLETGCLYKIGNC